jgi:hypothetical protein
VYGWIDWDDCPKKEIVMEVLTDRGRLKVRKAIVNGLEFYATSSGTFICHVQGKKYEVPYEVALAMRDSKFTEFMDHKEVMPVMGPVGGLARTILAEQDKAEIYYANISKEQAQRIKDRAERQALIRHKAMHYQINGNVPVDLSYRLAKLFYGFDPGPVIGTQNMD